MLERARVHLLPVLLVVAIGLYGSGGPPHIAAQTLPKEQPPGQWVKLGPDSGFRASSFAVSPVWPADRFIIAFGYDLQSRHYTSQGVGMVDSDIMRSLDGGKTWDRLAAPGISVDSLIVAPPTPGGRIVFASGASGPGTGYGFGISRSADAGATWSTALSVTAARSTPRSVRLSPDFANDGIAFATHDGILYRSQDFGATWSSVYPAGNQRVQQVEVSPAFTTDRTVAAAVVTGKFPQPWGEENDVRTAPHHETSMGLAISTDGGDTWQTAAAGLGLAGTPYRYVRNIAMSPDFGRDGVMFAFAWGPWDGAAVPAALFRSSDRGHSWAPAWQSDPAKDGMRWSASFALSPAFASDGSGQIAVGGVSGWNASPHSTPACLTYSTIDGGQAWSPVPRPTARAPGCTALAMTSGGPLGRTMYSLASPGGGAPASAHRSFDDGGTWELIRPPLSVLRSGYWPYALAGDSTFFVGTNDGIWGLGPSAWLTYQTAPPSESSTPIEIPGAPR